MADTPLVPGEVRIFPPSMALKNKLGPDGTFDKVFAPNVVASAQQVITNSAGEILVEVMNEVEILNAALNKLQTDAAPKESLAPVIAAAFAIKSKAGLCGYTFGSLLAKALHVYCELDSIQSQPLSARTIDIVRLLATGLKTIFTNKIMGDGGAVGQALLAEISKLSADVAKSMD